MKRAWESQGQKLNKRLKLLPTNGKAENIAEAKKREKIGEVKNFCKSPVGKKELNIVQGSTVEQKNYSGDYRNNKFIMWFLMENAARFTIKLRVLLIIKKKNTFNFVVQI